MRKANSIATRWRPDRTGQARLVVPVALLLTCMLTACGGDSSSSPATTTPLPGPTSTTAVVIAGPLDLGPIVWTQTVDPVTAAPTAPVQTFPSDSTSIIAVVQLSNVAAGSVLTATWSFNETSLDSLTSTIVATEPASERWIAFTLSAPPGTPWPSGVYAVSISANSEPRANSRIRVI